MIDHQSLTSCLLTIHSHGGLKSSKATGFIIKKNEQYYLATNWHVITGVDPNNGTIRFTPTTIKISYPTIVADLQEKTINLYDEKNKGKWLEYPKRQEVDAILLPIEPPPLKPLDLTLADTNILVQPADVVSVIGFPGGNTCGHNLPIWVTGFVASEPDIDIHGKPAFYINVSGYEGLSGAPVILKTKFYRDLNNNFHIGEEKIKFLGIYSGRLIDHSMEKSDSSLNHKDSAMHIGIIWKPTVFQDILQNNQLTDRTGPLYG